MSRMPLRAKSQRTSVHRAQALWHVELAFVICRSAEQGFCPWRQVVWEANVRSQSQAPQSKLTLHYTVRPF